MSSQTFLLRPIPPGDADELRHRGGPVYVADEHPGYPCRQCLEDAAVGDELILVSHDPFDVDSPYRSSSPIFLHREPCRPVANRPELPDQLTRRQLSVRSFDASAMMIDAKVIDGSDLKHTIEALLDDRDAEQIHVHNASRGCWAVTVDRSSRG